MNKLTKFASLLLLGLFTACESNENITEISGKVIDIETNKPVADANLEVTVSEGLQLENRFLNPVKYSAKSNAQGAYTFILPSNAKQQLFKVEPYKAGYVEVADKLIIANQLKQQQRNLYDIAVAKGSYLKVTFNKAPHETEEKEVLLNITHTLNKDTPPLHGKPIITEEINLTPATNTTSLVRGFYFKYTNTVHLNWQVTTTGDKPTTENFLQTIALAEHDTTHITINF
jgi:hypothetical protein